VPISHSWPKRVDDLPQAPAVLVGYRGHRGRTRAHRPRRDRVRVVDNQQGPARDTADRPGAEAIPALFRRSHRAIAEFGIDVSLIHRFIGRGTANLNQTPSKGGVSRLSALVPGGVPRLSALCSRGSAQVSQLSVSTRLESVAEHGKPCHAAISWLTEPAGEGF
jgi:hypothetical protein